MLFILLNKKNLDVEISKSLVSALKNLDIHV